MANRQRNIQLKIWVNEEERKLIEKKMAQLPTSQLGAYIRKMAIDGYIIYTDIKNIKQYIGELQTIGKNINQIAKRVNSTTNIYKEDIEEIKARLAEEVLGGKYEFVLTTHIDKGHIHNHIIYNSVSFTDYNHYHSTPPKYYNIRRTSDKLCEEYGLSVIRNPQSKGKSYIEHTAAKQGKSWKAQLKNTIDALIPLSKDFIIKTIIPILFAILLYSMFINICTDSAGTVDYMKLFILCGIPSGITRLIVFPLFGLNGMLATLIFSFFIGGAIGGIILIWRLLVTLYYIPLTAVRFVAAR